MSDAAQRRFTLDDDWAVELASPVRHEYIRGPIYALAKGTPRHNEIAANVQHALRRALEDTGCRPLGSDQRIRTEQGEYTYADVSVFCGRIEVAPSPPPDTATNPVLLGSSPGRPARTTMATSARCTRGSRASKRSGWSSPTSCS